MKPASEKPVNKQLAKAWDLLAVGQDVVLTHTTLMPIAGTIDAITDDQQIIWITSVPLRRRMIHIHDGYRIHLDGR